MSKLTAWPAFLAAFVGNPHLQDAIESSEGRRPDIADVRIGNSTCKSSETSRIEVELAITPEQHQRGLSRRREVPDGSGMLFVFDPPAPARFWMKDTWVPLTLLFFDKDGLLLSVHRMPVEPDPTRPVQRYSEPRPVSAALEIPTPPSENDSEIRFEPGKSVLCAGQRR